MPDTVSNQIFIQLALRNPADAWEEFLREYAAQIFTVIRTFETDDDRAGDCFQFVCERLVENDFRRLRKFQPNGSAKFTTWLRAVVRNLCLDWHRKQYGRRRAFRSIERLSHFDQEVFRLLYQRQLGTEEIFEQLAQTFPHVSMQDVAASRERIEQQLSEHQHWLLSVWAGTTELQTWDDPQDESPVTKTVLDPSPDPERLAIAKNQIQKLKRELASLPDRERLMLRLRFEEELSLEQCAKLLGLGNPQRVDRQIREVLSKLKERFN